MLLNNNKSYSQGCSNSYPKQFYHLIKRLIIYLPYLQLLKVLLQFLQEAILLANQTSYTI